MNLQNHDKITRAGCSRLSTSCHLNAAQLTAIVLGNWASDANQGSSAIHYVNCAFLEGSDRISKCWTALASESDRFSPRSLKAFGGLLHTTQDFYAHSNWIELQEGISPLPLWNRDLAPLPPGLFSATARGAEPKRCNPGVPDHDEFNKDGQGSAAGKKKVQGGPNDGKTRFELAYEAACEATVAEFDRFLSGVTVYKVTTMTGDCVFGGTDAKVFLILHGENGKDTGRIYLNNIDRNDFERGRADSFIIGTAAAIDGLERITIGYDTDGDQGLFPGWFLEKVIVERLGGPDSWSFSSRRWLARDEGDRKTIVDLIPD